jgi:hypothetical protein
MGRACSLNGEKRKAYTVLVGKQEIKRLQARPRRRWVDNTKVDLRVIGWDGIDWIDLAEDRDQWRSLMNTVMKLRVPYNFGKSLSSFTTCGFSRTAHLHGVS